MEKQLVGGIRFCRENHILIFDLYAKHQNVWKVAEHLQKEGICIKGQSIHKHLETNGIINKIRVLTEEEKKIIIEEYEIYANSARLKELSKRLNRTEQYLSRQARKLGLTKKERKYSLSHEQRIINSERARRRILTHGHPKGMLGKKHTLESKEKFRQNSKKMWQDPYSKLNSEEHRQKISDRMSKLQAEGKLANNYSRTKSGTVIIGGKEIFFRSSWECNIAAYFQFLFEIGDIKSWEYEPTVFWFEKIKRGVRSYKPDFKITKNDGSEYYVEVKGWMDNKSKTKLKRMKIYYPNVILDLIDSVRYKAISKNKGLYKEWGKLTKNEVIEFKKCKVDGCDNKMHSKELCRKHFYKAFGS